ncbi:hypothetical protein [Streptococcus uberis]|uniref:hypothetical protein n=1 Tax=Streptococcus uberis TaxID=1349 RepID=UPI000620384E|nr:hypothetical protein [Streptococcus uberis]KKF45932.1 membrane protein [Streptococcus uberis C5072]
MKGKSITGWKAWIMLILMLIGAFETGYLVAEIKYEPRIASLHKQLRRTQYQLKKTKKQNVEQTQKISELTGNGG